MYSLMILSPIASFSNSSRLVGIWDGLLVGVRRPSPTSRLLSWPQIRISRCLPRNLPWYPPLESQIWVDLTLYIISLCLLGLGAQWNPPSWARNVLIWHHNRVPRSVPHYIFLLEVWAPRLASRKEGISGTPHCQSPLGKLTEESYFNFRPSCFPMCLWPQYWWDDGSTPPSAVW